MGALDKLKAAAQAAKRIRNESRNAEFTMATAGSDSIFANLATTQSGISSSLNASQAAILAGMERLSARGAKQSTRGVARAGDRAANLFGSAMGPGIEQDLGPARAIAEATGAQGRAAVGAGGLAARGASTAMDMMSAAATEAQAGVDYQFAQALSYRASQDAALTAEARLMMAEKKYDARQAEKEEQKEKSNATTIGAQETLLDMAMQPGASAEQLTNVASQLELTYNLPRGTLTNYVKTMFDEEGNSTVAGPLLDAAGNVIQTDLDDEDELQLKKDTLAWLKDHPDTPDVAASKEHFLNSMVARPGEEGTWTMSDGQQVSPQLAQAMRDYAGEQFDAASGSFYESEAAADASEQAAKEDVLFGKVSNASASFLGLDDGDVGWDTVLTIASFFIPLGKVGGLAIAGAEKLGIGAAKVGLRAGIKALPQGARAAAPLAEMVANLTARSTAAAAKSTAGAAARGTVQGGVKKGLSATASQFAAGRAAPAATAGLEAAASSVARPALGAATSAAEDVLAAQVAARTGQVVLRSAVTGGLDDASEPIIRQLLAELATPKGARNWKLLLEQLIAKNPSGPTSPFGASVVAPGI